MLYAALGCGVLLLYAETLWALVAFWATHARWQFFIPVLFVYMLFSRRREMAEVSVGRERIPGGVIMGAAVLLLIAGRVVLVDFFGDASLPLCIMGVVLYLWGLNRFSLFFVPLCYLYLLLPQFAGRPVAVVYPLQIVSAKLAAIMLKAAGLSILQQDHYIRLPLLTLNVVEWCSGLNQLVTLASISVPLAYLFHRSFWRQCLIIGFSVPTAVLFNGLRIFCIGLYNYRVVRENIHGPFDIFRMPFIFLGGLFFLFFVSRLVERLFPEKKGRHSEKKRYPAGSAVVRRADWVMVLSIFLVTAVLYANRLVPARSEKRFFYTLREVCSQEYAARVSDTVSGPVPGKSFSADDWWLCAVDSTTRIYAGFFAFQRPGQKILLEPVDPALRATGETISVPSPFGVVEGRCFTDENEKKRYTLFPFYHLDKEVVAGRSELRKRLVRKGFGFSPRSATIILAFRAEMGESCRGIDLSGLYTCIEKAREKAGE